jgi:hypothetical protein
MGCRIQSEDMSPAIDADSSENSNILDLAGQAEKQPERCPAFESPVLRIMQTTIQKPPATL